MNDEALVAARDGNVGKLKKMLEKEIDLDVKDKSGLTLLHHATSSDRHDVVKCLLQNGADVLLGTNNEGDTVLHIAVAKNDESLVKVILENVPGEKLKNLVDAKINVDGTAALHVAAKLNSFKIVLLLLEYGANFEIKNAVEEKPIDLATNEDIRNFLSLINDSFERAKSSDERLGYDLGSIDDGYLSPVLSCRNNDAQTLVQAFIINFRVDTTNLPFECDGGKVENLLHLRLNLTMDRDASALCSLTRRDIIDELIALVHECRRLCFVWPDNNEMSQFAKTLDTFYLISRKYFASQVGTTRGLDKIREVMLVYRKMKGSLTADVTTRCLDEIFEIFGTDLDERDQTERYKVKLPAKWNEDIASFLSLILSHVGSLLYMSIISIDHCLASALLFHAVKNGDLCETRRLLTVAPASPHVVDIYARTVLCYAAENDDSKMIKLLLKLGVNPNCENTLPWFFEGKGWKLDASIFDVMLKLYGNPDCNRPLSPLYLAVRKGHAKSVKTMLKRIDTKVLAELIDRRAEELGDTALHVAAKLGRLDLVKMLLKNGASFEILNDEGSTPLDVSIDDEVTELLTLVDGCFHDAREANVELVYKLKAMMIDLFVVVASTKNRDGQTLAVVAGKAGAKNVAGVILKMIRDAKQD